MPFPVSRLRQTALRLGAVLHCLLAAGAVHAQAGTPCDTREQCIAAILAAGGAGDEMRQLALMGELTDRYRPMQASQPSGKRPLARRPQETLAPGDPGERLIELVRYTGSNDTPMPEQVRALALAYLIAKRPDDAERELAEGLASQPVHAPFWLDLAQVYMQQGRPDRAVSALVTAEAWAFDQKALRDTYRQLARAGATPAIQALHAQALQRIDARLAERARQDAAVPPPTAAGKLPEGAPTPKFLPETCRVRPAYPRSSLRYEETGTVTWAFLVGADGRMLAVRKLKSSGFADLDSAALLPLSTCRTEPAVADGKPLAAWRSIEYVWTLD
jgi:TonB family protein